MDNTTIKIPRISEKYHSFRLIGCGGMSRVYRAIHAELGLPFAIKVLTRTTNDPDKAREELVSEARVLLCFSHPQITQLRDFGRTEDGELYLAMDLCHGQSLSTVIEKRGRWPALQALKLCKQLLDVLSAAHELHIVHRDLKPDNLFLERNSDGSIKLRILDFGIAGLAWKGSGASQAFSIGTPLYMAPEQILSFDAVDARTDLYSVGIMLYELLTGDVPFYSEDLVELLEKHLYQPIPGFAPELGVPLSVQKILFKALEKKPEHRFQTAADFSAQISEVLYELHSQAAKRNETLWRVPRKADDIMKYHKDPLKILI